MTFRLLAFLYFLIIVTPVFSQDNQNSVIITGKILDQASLQPIPATHIYSGNKGTYADFDGSFSLQLDKSDTIVISHVAYYNQYIVLDTLSSAALSIYLQREVQLLDHFTLNQFPDLQIFKQQILNTKVKDEKLENALRNIDLIRLQFLAGYGPDMTSLDNFKHYLKGPEGVKLLSSNPNKGLTSILRRNNSASLFRGKNTGESAFENFFPFSNNPMDSSHHLIADSI